MNIGEDEEDELFDGTVACVFTTAEKKINGEEYKQQQQQQQQKERLHDEF